MNQQIRPQETVQPLMVQALWVSQAIGVLMSIGMIAYLVAEGLKVGTEVLGKVIKK